MLEQNVKIKLLKENAKVPTYGTPYAAGADIYACIDEDITINPKEAKMIPTGFALEVPVGYAGLIYPRSGLACKRGLAPANKVGVVDTDYRGEVMVFLYNQSDVAQTVEVGERIAQLIITPYLKANFELSDSLDETDRGDSGFGSTGRK